jgi:hypothetical protein
LRERERERRGRCDNNNNNNNKKKLLKILFFANKTTKTNSFLLILLIYAHQIERDGSEGKGGGPGQLLLRKKQTPTLFW